MRPLDDRQFNRLAVTGLALAFLLLVGAFVAAVLEFSGGRRSTELVRHTDQVIEQIGLLDVQLERAESARRGFLLVPSSYRQGIYQANAKLAGQTLNRLATLTSDNPVQVRQIASVRKIVADELAEIQTSIDLASAGRTDDARKLFVARGDGSAIRAIREHTTQMRDTENRLHAERSEAERARDQSLAYVLGGIGLLLFLVGGASFWLVRRYTRDLTATRDRLNLLNTDLESAVAERTTDLQRANEEIQRFAYIVSHDLRSPLVNILGFTGELEAASASIGKLLDKASVEAPQLVTEDARNTREDLPEAITFIRSSAQKMDRLINAILKISREGRRTLAPEKLDMNQIVGEIIDGVSHRALEAGAKVEIDGNLPSVFNDRMAVEQILSNLIENALKYLQPGRPGEIRIHGQRRASMVDFEVRDNGRGIDKNDHERVFELFRRAGSQDQPGEGIGLAHVRALAYRLGGLVTLESELGVGSTFRLSLPAVYGMQGGGQ